MFDDMFEINVGLWQWVTSQILGFIILIIVVIAFQVKRKTITLALISCAILIGLAMHALLENWIALALGIVTFVRFLTFLWLELREEKGRSVNPKLSLAILLFFCAALVIATILTHGGQWFSWVFLAGNIIATYGFWAKGPHLMRLSNIQISILIIINSIMFQNPMNVLIETFVLASIAIFYIRYFRTGVHAKTKD